MQIKIPTIDNQNSEIINISNQKSCILVGASGAGKTRLSIYIGEQIEATYKRHLECKNEIGRLKEKLEEWENKKDDDVENNIAPYVSIKYNIFNKDRKQEVQVSLYEFINICLKSNSITQFNGTTSITAPPQSLEDIQGGTLSHPSFGTKGIDVDLLKYSEKYRTADNKENIIKDYINYNKNRIKKRIETNEEELEAFGNPIFEKVHRISAHRQLTLNQNLSPTRLEQAKPQLVNPNSGQWQKSITAIQNDFGKLIVLLYSEEAEISSEYTQKIREKKQAKTPQSALSSLIKFWNDILPHRQLTLKKLTIEVQNINDTNTYAPSEMSDGERNIFYILGQCLLAPKDSLCIIDEPELHINRSIANDFWNYIKEKRQDCAFLFITHDIDFVNANSDAQKYFIKKYQHRNKWHIENIDKKNERGLLENIKLIVLGSRKDVIFVEGGYDSLDFIIYSKVYNDYFIIPVGSCQQVKQQVNAIAQNKQFHHIKAYGIIDGDSLNNEEKQNNQTNQIYALSVAIIENIFLLEEVINKICKIENIELDKNYKDKIFNFVTEHQKSDLKKKTKHRLGSEIQAYINEKEIDSLELEKFEPKKLYKNFENELKGFIETKDLNKVLSFCQNKGLYQTILKQVLNCNDVKLKIISLLRQEDVLDCIRKHLPSIR